jgi:hypothetical protein
MVMIMVMHRVSGITNCAMSASSASILSATASRRAPSNPKGRVTATAVNCPVARSCRASASVCSGQHRASHISCSP